MNELQTGKPSLLRAAGTRDGRSIRLEAANADHQRFSAVIKPAFTVCKKSRIPRSFGNRINCAAIPHA
jgi:hypothetical protein